MKLLVVVFGILFFAAGPVLAEEKPLSFEFAESTLAEAAKVLGVLANVEIVVEADLTAIPVTLRVKDLGLEACLALLAKLSGPDIEWRKEAEGKYRIARKVPEWKAALLAKLAETRMDLDFADMPVEEVARFLSGLCGASVVIDPAWLGETEAGERNLTLKVEEASLRESLDLLTVLKGLAWEARWGVVFIATKERLAGLPAALLPAPAAEQSEADAALRARLAGGIALDFDEAMLSEGLEFIRKAAKVDSVLSDEAVRKYAEETPISIRLADVTVEHALCVLLLPRGFRAAATEGKLVFTRP
jgi:hypothetical protein